MRKLKPLIVFFAVAAASGFLYFRSIEKPSVLGTSSKKGGKEFIGGNLREKIGDKAKYSVDRNTGKVTFLSGGEAGSLPFSLEKMAKKEPAAVADKFMEEYGGYFGLEDSSKELKILDKKKDDLGMNHVIYNQVYKGVPVFGAQAAVHLKKNLSVSSVNGKFVPDVSVGTEPKISQKDAEDRAGELWREEFDGADYQVVKIMLYVFNKGLAENKKDDRDYLTWEVELVNKEKRKHELYFIDAENGDLVFQITGTKKAIHRHVYDCSLGSCVMDFSYAGYVYGRSEGQAARGTNPVYGGTDTDSLYAVTSSMYDYLSARFSRNGANNQGGLGDGYYSAVTNTDSFAYINLMG